MRAVSMLATDCSLDVSGDAMRVSRGIGEIVLNAGERDRQELVNALAVGTDDHQISEIFERHSSRTRLELAAFLATLRQIGWVVDQLWLGSTKILTRTITSDWYEPIGADPTQAYSLSRFALLRNHEGGLLIESPRCHARAMMMPGSAPWLHIFSEGVARGWDHDENLAAVVRMLAECGLLVPKGEDGLTVEDRDPILEGWDFHDLLFHSRSRAGRHRDPYGKADLGPEAARSIRGSEVSADRLKAVRKRLALARPDLHGPGPCSQPFGTVLERRRSLRQAPADPLNVEILGEFLFRSARIQQFDESTPAGSSRPFASAAGLNELELYLNVHNCSGLEPGFYHYDARDHALELIDVPNGTRKPLDRFCGTEPIGIHFICAANFAKVNCRYDSLAYSLILRNAGCLIQTMYLVATALGRAPCAIGAGDADLFARATGLAYEVQGSVADFVLR